MKDQIEINLPPQPGMTTPPPVAEFKPRARKQKNRSDFGVPHGWKPSIVIAFVRCSSVVQGDGSTAQRQVSRIRQICNAFGWPEPIWVTSIGASAWKKDKTGKTIWHSEKGKFGKWLVKIKARTILKGALFIFENADRFSRAPLDEADNNLMEILRNDYYVYFASMDMLLQPGDQNVGYKRTRLQQEFERANEESDRKSGLVQDSYDARLAKYFKTGKKQNFGGVVPSWIVWDSAIGDYIEDHKSPAGRDMTHWDVGRKIIELAHRPIGISELVRQLETADPPIPLFKRNRRSARWSYPTVKKFLCSKSLIGTLTILGHEIPNYFPAIATAAEWKSIQARFAVKRERGGGTAKTNRLLTLMPGRVHCHHCKRVMVSNASNGFANRSYVCPGRVEGDGCRESRRVYIDAIEFDLITQVLQKTPAEIGEEKDQAHQTLIADLQSKIAAIEKPLARARYEYLDRGNADCQESYYNFKAKKEQIAAELAAAMTGSSENTGLILAWKELNARLKKRLSKDLSRELISETRDAVKQIAEYLYDHEERRGLVEPLKLIVERLEISVDDGMAQYQVQFVGGGLSEWRNVTKLVSHIKDSHYDHLRDPEFRKANSRRNKGRKLSPEVIEGMRKAATGRKHTLATRQLIGDHTRAQWKAKTPQQLERMVKAIRANHKRRMEAKGIMTEEQMAERKRLQRNEATRRWRKKQKKLCEKQGENHNASKGPI